MSSQVTEFQNRCEFLSLAVPFGFSPYMPQYDDGIDFILHRGQDNVHLNVQLKGRWNVAKKYFGRRIWIAFPDKSKPKRSWYLVPHDLLVARGQEGAPGATPSWENGGYHKEAPSKGWGEQYSEYELTKLLASMTPEQAKSVDGHANAWMVGESL